MDPATLAALIAQLVTTGIQAYAQLRAANPSTIPPLTDILNAANADWDAVAKMASGQLATPKS